MTKDTCKKCKFLNENLCTLHNNTPIKDIKYVLGGTTIDCGCPFRARKENE